MTKRIIAFVLCILFALTAFASCGANDEKTVGTAETKASSGTVGRTESLYSEEEQAAIDKAVGDRIAEIKADCKGFDGATFTMVGHTSSAFPTEDEITGDRESDCVYERNKTVSEEFNIVYDLVPTETGVIAGEKVMQDRDAGLNEIDLSFGSLLTIGSPLFSGGYLSEISDYPEIDITNPWWLGTMEDYYSVGGKLMFLDGDILPGFFDTAWCVVYNKTVAENYGVTEDLYACVKDGKWTIDKMFETASAIPGGGDVKRYGNADYEVGTALMIASGVTLTKFDEEGTPILEESLPAIVDTLSVKCNAQTGDDAYCYNGHNHHEELGSEEVIDKFVDNKMLYMFTHTLEVANMRRENVDSFGILPMPKYDENQEKYYTFSQTGTQGSIYLAKNPTDAVKVGTIVEAMGAYSYKMIRPVYYDLRLKTQSVYDIASKDMLDIICESQVYELYELYGDGSYYKDGDLFMCLTEGIFTNNETLSSSYKSLSKTTSLRIKSLMREVKKYYTD